MDACAKHAGTLVFIHGGGSNRTSSYFGSLDFYRAMVDQGIAVAAIDLRNHGESSCLKTQDFGSKKLASAPFWQF